MRGHRVVLVVVMVLGALAPTTQAGADGGAYLEFDRTYYLAGDHAVATASVLIPKRRVAILGLGPFYAYALPAGRGLGEGKPIPDSAFALGMVTPRSRGETMQLDLGFTMPALPPGDYSVEICNNPCTISGFREPLSGFFSIVETRREARLIVQGYRYQAKIAGLNRKLKKVERTEVPRAEFESLRAERDELAAQIEDLQAAARAAADHPGRPLIDGWAALALCGSVLLVATMLVRRRRRAAVVGEAVVEEPDALADAGIREPAEVR